MVPCKYEKEIGEFTVGIKTLGKSIDLMRESQEKDMVDLKTNHLRHLDIKIDKLGNRLPQTTVLLITALCSLCVGLIVFLLRG